MRCTSFPFAAACSERLKLQHCALQHHLIYNTRVLYRPTLITDVNGVLLCRTFDSMDKALGLFVMVCTVFLHEASHQQGAVEA